MNRTTAIFLLPLMMIFAIRPVIALHYCAGELQSLNMFTQQTSTAISLPPVENPMNNHSCCDSHKPETGRHDYEWHTPGNRCCDTELLELTTDDYQNKSEQQASRLFSLSIDNVQAVLSGLFKLSDLKTDIPIPHPDFPPEGLFLKDVSLLTYICIYRI